MIMNVEAPAHSGSDTSDDLFYGRVTVFESFDKAAEPSLYQPLPAGWVVGATPAPLPPM